MIEYIGAAGKRSTKAVVGWIICFILKVKQRKPSFVHNVRWKHKLVVGIVFIWVIVEGVFSEHNGVLKLAAHWERVAYNSPLRTATKNVKICKNKRSQPGTARTPCDTQMVPVRPLSPAARPKQPLSSPRRESDPPDGTSLRSEYRPCRYHTCTSAHVCLSVDCTFVRVRLANPLGRLEGMEGVGKVHVRIGLIHQLV